MGSAVDVLSAGAARPAHLRVNRDYALAGESDKVAAFATAGAEVGSTHLGGSKIDGFGFG